MTSKLNSQRRRVIKNILSKGNKKYHCAFCKSVLDIKHLTIEHILPKNNGGSNKISNLILTCRTCNNHRCRGDFYKYSIWMMNDVEKPKGTKSGGNKNRKLKNKLYPYRKKREKE